MAAWLRCFNVICLVLLVAAPMSGCGTTTDENASLAGKPLKGAQARLKIFRTSEFIAAVPSARVKVDGRQVAELGVGGSTMLDVPAGARTVVVDAVGHPNVYSITLKAKAGMLYTLEISPRTEAAVAGALFGLVGALVEAGVNQNGGTFQVRVVDAKPAG
jgi:uncharacterized protein YceK